MKTVALSASPRSETGKGPNRRLRQNGQIPAILYGQGLPPTLLSIGDHEFHHAVDKLGDEMVMFRIEAETAGVQNQLAVIRELQRDPVTDGIVHMDFMRIDMTKPIEVEVAVHGTGVPAGLQEGGVLEQVLRTVRVRCLPELVPSHIRMEISHLALNQALNVRDVSLGEGIEILSLLHEVLFHVVPPRKMEEVAPAVEAAPEEGAAEPEVIGKKETGKKEEEETKTSE